MQMLGPVDTAFWQLDNDITPMNLGGILIVDGPIDFDQLVRLVDSRLHMAPLYQQRVMRTPLNLGEPTWAYDPDFYVENHMFRLRLDAPGTEDQLRELCGQLISSTLDRSKPLWELYMIEGLENDYTAIMFKVHHCMVDGISAVELFTLMLDFSDDTPDFKRKPVYNPPKDPGTTDLLRHAVTKAVPHRWNILKKIGSEAMDLGMGMVDRRQRKKTLMGLVSFINDNLTPIKPLAISGKNSGDIRLAWVEFSLADIKAIRRQRRSSINEVMLSILGGAIGKYQENYGDNMDQDFVRVVVPVNMRTGDTGETFGNRISVLPIEVPLFMDPLERLASVKEYSMLMKESNLSSTLDMVLSLPSLIPSVAQPVLWNIAPRVFGLLAHTWCTNVPGPQIPLYLLGRRMVQVMGFFPINPSMGLATVILSYNQRITMNLMADAAIVPDVAVMRDYLRESFEELRAAAGVEPSEPIELEREPAQNADDAESNDEADAPPPPKEAPAAHTPKPADSKSEPAEKPKLMSPAWASALHDEINSSRAYYDASRRWTAGSVGMVMKASPKNDFPEDVGVYLDLFRGKCREADSMPVPDLKRRADFILEGTYDVWMEILDGRSQALPMIMRGRLRLTKGAMRKLLPFTKSSQELVNCAMRIS